jgi:hypothetical protein
MTKKNWIMKASFWPVITNCFYLDEQNSRSSSPRPKTARTNQENGRKRSKINNEDDSDSDPMFKTKEQPKYRRNSSIMSEKSNCQTDKLEDGPCTMHSQSAEECSHSKFKNVRI